jgi:pyrroline-5-carboxylate reductase
MEHTICFIGAGTVSHAIIGGLSSGGTSYHLRASDVSHQARQSLSDLYQVQVFANNLDPLIGSDVILCAVKPQDMDTLLQELKGHVRADQLLISVAAGTNCKQINTALGEQQAIVRTMPNTPALIGMGITGMYANQYCTDQQRWIAEEIFSAVGEFIWVEQESQIDAVTAVSGSGPAYFYYLIEALRDSAMNMGIEPETANRLVLKTAVGAAALAMRSELDIQDLREQVTSAGGTTEAALNTLRKGAFKELMDAAVHSAEQRSRELAQS